VFKYLNSATLTWYFSAVDYALHGNRNNKKIWLEKISLNSSASVKGKFVNLIMQYLLYHTKKTAGYSTSLRLIVVLHILSS